MGLTCVAVRAGLVSVEHHAEVEKTASRGWAAADSSPQTPETVEKMMRNVEFLKLSVQPAEISTVNC